MKNAAEKAAFEMKLVGTRRFDREPGCTQWA
jgi:hypothetical protein